MGYLSRCIAAGCLFDVQCFDLDAFFLFHSYLQAHFPFVLATQRGQRI
jgi:hypothetical protein